MSSFDSYVFQKQLELEEYALNAYLEHEGIKREDFDTWPQKEQTDWFLCAVEWHQEECDNNGQFGLGA